MDFDLTSALQNKMQSDPDAAHRLGLIENDSPVEDVQGEKVDHEEHMKQCRSIADNLLKKLQEKQNAIVFFQDKQAHIALSQLDSAEQATFLIKAKEACKGLNRNDAKRVIKEASGQEKRKKTGTALSQGLIQRHGQYLTEKMTPDGPVPVAVSNFIVESVEKIKTDSKDLLKIHVFIGGSDTPIERIVSANDFLGRKELLKAINCVDAQWTGNDQNVQMLVGHLANVDTPTKRGVPYIGPYGDRFITPKAIFTERGPELESGFVYIPQKTAFEEHIKFPPCGDWKALVKRIFSLILYIQPANVLWPILGWFFACVVSSRIRRIYNEFPILHCYGTGGSGKTSLIQLFLWMLGVMAEPYSASGKEFVILRTLSTTNALPVFMDEYRPLQMDPRKLKTLHEKLLLCYKASIESRGKADQSTVEYRLTAPIVMAGEAPLPEAETGLMERVLQVRFDRNFINSNPEAEKNFNKLAELPLSEFAAGYIVWVMGMDIETIFKTALGQINKILRGIRVASRIKHNLATVLTGIILFSELAKKVEVNIPALDAEMFRRLAGEDFAYRKEPRNAVDRFMLHLSAMAHTGELRYGVDYLLNEEDPDIPKLIFSTAAVISAQQKHCKARGIEVQMVSDKALRIMLEERISDYILIPFGYKARIGSKSLRTTVINAQRLEELLDIDVDTWRSSSKKEKEWNCAPDDDKSQNIDRLRVAEELFNES